MITENMCPDFLESCSHMHGMRLEAVHATIDELTGACVPLGVVASHVAAERAHLPMTLTLSSSKLRGPDGWVSTNSPSRTFDLFQYHQRTPQDVSRAEQQRSAHFVPCCSTTAKADSGTMLFRDALPRACRRRLLTRPCRCGAGNSALRRSVWNLHSEAGHGGSEPAADGRAWTQRQGTHHASAVHASAVLEQSAARGAGCGFRARARENYHELAQQSACRPALLAVGSVETG